MLKVFNVMISLNGHQRQNEKNLSYKNQDKIY